jgi:hypothetical protein
MLLRHALVIGRAQESDTGPKTLPGQVGNGSRSCLLVEARIVAKLKNVGRMRKEAVCPCIFVERTVERSVYITHGKGWLDSLLIYKGAK